MGILEFRECVNASSGWGAHWRLAVRRVRKRVLRCRCPLGALRVWLPRCDTAEPLCCQLSSSSSYSGLEMMGFEDEKEGRGRGGKTHSVGFSTRSSPRL